MANEEVLGPRKTMFVLVIVVGCFAVLWPRILSPLLVGHQRAQLQPNQFDRDAGCCDVMFGTELTVLELINEVCSSAVHVNGKLSPIAAAECRKAVNETCGVDIAAFLKRTDNIGKSSRLLVQTMQSSNSSCLKEHFGVPLVSLGPHLAINSWILQDTIKQERPPIRGAGPHPALRERGRAIPPGAPPAAPQAHIQMPPNVRVRTSPLQGYFELDVKPPPIPGMRPPLGSPGGPAPAPKSSMGFVMPIYTICIIVFFVYTISKLFFKRATIPYEPVSPDPHFRRRVFRDDSRSSPDKLGPKERDTIVTAISGLVAEVQQQMEAGYAQNQQRQDVQDNHTRPYTNGTIIHNSGPVHIIASEYEAKETTPEKDSNPEPKLTPDDQEPRSDEKKPSADDDTPDSKKADLEEVVEETVVVQEKEKDELKEKDSKETDARKESQIEESIKSDMVENSSQYKDEEETESKVNDKPTEEKESTPEREEILIDLSKPVEIKSNGHIRTEVEDFLKEEAKNMFEEEKTKELLEEAIGEDEELEDEEEEVEEEEEADQEKSSVKVVGMEVRAHAADGGAFPAPRAAAPAHPQPHAAPHRTPHEAELVQSIFLETAIPQQSRVLVADCEDSKTDERDHTSPMVVSGKMTLSLIQDAPRDTPDRDLESTVDDFTTASAVTQPAEKEGSDSEEEVEEEEIEIEEIEEEEEEEEEIEEKPIQAPKKGTE